ncbi:MAG: hypothetical protein FD173_1337 [Gallionellaceae bacterium]|nr:MAG: hypothetical protein FD173_1337 [Gallionellaceae bacterium]
MDKNSNSDNAAVESAVETLPPLSVGKILREARISQGLNVADVASSIKFSPRQVEALEADDYSHLPELAFVRGFVRSYARLLHIDETPLLDFLPRAHQQLTSVHDELAGVPFSTSQSTRRINVTWLSAALALAVFLGIAVWLSQDKPEVIKAGESPLAVAPAELAASAVAVVASPSLVVSGVPAAVATLKDVMVKKEVTAPKENVTPKEVVAAKGEGQGAIRLVFEDESWVDVKDKFGKTIFKQVNPPKSEQWISGHPPFSLVIGNASSVRLYYEGEEIDLDEFTDVEVARLILE